MNITLHRSSAAAPLAKTGSSSAQSNRGSIILHPSSFILSKAPGFSLMELLVVVTVIAILAALLLPALSQAKNSAQCAACLDNLREQQVAWHVYIDDNRDALPPNDSFSSVSEPNSTNDPVTAGAGATWCPGIAPLDTNTSNIEQGVLFPYNRSAGVYRCPSDVSLVASNACMLRTRSYCMNISLACDDAAGCYRKMAEIFNPSPPRVFVLIDTHELDIWDATFGIFSSDSAYAAFWLDLPADRHAQGANLSFADGHTEHWRWKAPKRFVTRWQITYDPDDLADLKRLQECAKLGMD